MTQNKIYVFSNKYKITRKKLQDCRQYDNKKDWSTRRTNQELLKHFEEDEKIQKIIIEQAKKHNYEIIDISKNREEKLEIVYEKIKSRIEK